MKTTHHNSGRDVLPSLVASTPKPLRRVLNRWWTKRAYFSLLYRLDNRQQATISVGPATATFDIMTPLEHFIICRGSYEAESAALRDFLSNLRDDDVVWDIGGHIGLYGVLAGDIVSASGGSVEVFEPHPRNAGRVWTNAALNDGNIHVNNVALSDRTGTMTFVPGRATISAQGRLTEDRNENGITVSLSTGDTLIEEGTPAPSVMKIDVEGSELDVLRGMPNVLARDECRLVYYETHPEDLAEKDQSQADVEQHLEEYGFEIEETGARRMYKATR